MSRSLGILCAGALLLATAGCTLDSFFLSITGSSNRKEQTVALSVDQVSASLQATVSSKFGILLAQSRHGEEVHLDGQTRGGEKFTFILQRQKSENGERTVIAFEGEKQTELLLWENVLISLASGSQPQQQQNQPASIGIPSANANPGLTPQRVQGGIQ